MNEWVDTVVAFYDTHRVAAVLAACAAGVALLTVVGWQGWAAYRGRSFNARASMGFAVVQGGVAYVTITGVYDFWHRRVDMPMAEAALIAAFIEAVTWAAVAMIFAHGAEPGSTGMGHAAPLFWGSVVGGGIMAVLGSPGLAVAAGRTVVVVLGGLMWHLRIRQKTRPAIERKPAKFALTPRQVLIRMGLLIADDADVLQSSREWQVRQLARAVRRSADGNLIARPLGRRVIVRVMEAGDADMVRTAQSRYALGRVLLDDLTPDSASMRAAIDAARAALYPPPPEPVPTAPAPPPGPSPAPPARRRPVGRTSAASAARADAAAAQDRKAEAEAWAVELLTSVPPKAVTGRGIGTRFGLGEEWGRQRLIAARELVASRNGHTSDA